MKERDPLTELEEFTRRNKFYSAAARVCAGLLVVAALAVYLLTALMRTDAAWIASSVFWALMSVRCAAVWQADLAETMSASALRRALKEQGGQLIVEGYRVEDAEADAYPFADDPEEDDHK